MIGTKVGRYVITQEIGDGGHAFVFKGESERGERVAIKMLKPSVAEEDNLEKRFVQEAEALKKLHHSHIVGFQDYIFMNGYHYLVMEHMDQGSVEDLLDTMGPIPHRYAIPIFYKVLDAMQFSHDRGYVHRDMKPNNILINSEGEAKLSDFGIAKVMGASGQNLTAKGFVLGTTLYMAPEFISQGVVSIQTDIYALGVTFFEMLTNRKPFDFERDDEPLVNFARRVCRGEAKRPSEYVEDFPRELERIVMKSIAQNPKDRYRTAAEFMKDLARSFPDLVNRAIVIPKGTGRAMTKYVDLQGEGLDQLVPNTATSRGTGGSSRGLAAGAALALGLVATALAPLVVPSLRDLPAATLWGAGGAVSAALAALVWFGLSRRRSADVLRAPASAKTAAPKGADPEAIISDSELEDFSSSGDEIPEPNLDLEDTIPFQEPSTRRAQPFKMTDLSELEAYLVVTSGPDEGRRFGLRPISRIGRDLRLDIRPHDPEISRHHAVLAFDGSGFTIEDLGSTNGTFVNEVRLVGKIALQNGDAVRVGSTHMRFEFKGAKATSPN